MPSKKCECFYLSELNMEINVISKKYIRICPKHSNEVFLDVAERKEYRFCKKKNLYILKDPSCVNNTINLDIENEYKFLLTSKRSTDSNLSTSNSSLSSLDENNYGKTKGRNNSSFIDMQFDLSIEDIDNGDEIVHFGKYRGLTFNQLLKKDRKYCVNILEVEERKNKEVPSNMKELSDYIKGYFKKN